MIIDDRLKPFPMNIYEDAVEIQRTDLVVKMVQKNYEQWVEVVEMVEMFEAVGWLRVSLAFGQKIAGQ